MSVYEIEVEETVLNSTFDEFLYFLKVASNENFAGFRTSKYVIAEEDYKYEIYEDAKRKLRMKDWSEADIGSGRIQKAVSSAVFRNFNYRGKSERNNLVYWIQIDDFEKLPVDASLERLFYDFYKNRIPDSAAFEKMLEFFDYQMIAYLFFIKNREQYLPISQKVFDYVFSEKLNIPNFKTVGSASWENYKAYLEVIKQVHRYLKRKGTEPTLLDAHSYLWIFGKQMKDWYEKNPKSIYRKTQETSKSINLLDEVRDGNDDSEVFDMLDVPDFVLDSSDETVEDELELERISALNLPAAEKEQIINARRGQGRFRKMVASIEKGCRLTGVTDLSFLIASHIKPWCESEIFEKLDGHNGLLLSPHVDKLFDNGFISFTNDGQILCKSDEVRLIMQKWGIDPEMNIGSFDEKQQVYLAYHRSKFGFSS